VQLGLRPVRNLALQVQALAADTLDRRLDGSAQPEELAALVQHVNDLLDRLHQAYEQLEAFNADVAHELFTPLATLIGGTEVALRKAREADELREVLGEHLEELQRMSSSFRTCSSCPRLTAARRLGARPCRALPTSPARWPNCTRPMEEAGLRWRVDGDARGASTPACSAGPVQSHRQCHTARAAGSEVVVRIEEAVTRPR
jgi:two-component system heavy metal sensor histidine kinase CusS